MFKFCKNFCVGKSMTDLKQVAVQKKRSVIELKSQVDEICPICIESVKNKRVKILPCGHRYHVACINKWLNRAQNTCATCRCIVDESKVVNCKKILDVLDDSHSIIDLLRIIESLFEMNDSGISTNFSLIEEDLLFSDDDLEEI